MLNRVLTALAADVCFLAGLLFLLPSSLVTPALAAGFDCTRASMKVDYIICRSAEGRSAIAALSAAWDNVIGGVTPERKNAILQTQRQWNKSYPGECGVEGRGLPGPDPNGAADACVVAKLRQRTLLLRSWVSGGSSDPETSAERSTPSIPTPDCAWVPKLQIDTSSSMSAGDWLPVAWSRCAAPKRLEKPTFLIITIPDEVRLRGTGFYSLRPGARAPFGFEIGADRARIIIPLHQPFVPAAGSVDVSPLIAGSLQVEAAVIRHDGDRNVVLWRSEPMSKRVTPGTPEVSVWQEASKVSPDKIMQSNDGHWELRTYSNTYEVVDRKSGDLVIRRAGTDPIFSPTQRFLIAHTPPDDTVEMIDLTARRAVRGGLQPFIVWSHNDSFAFAIGNRYCAVSIVLTIVDTLGPSSGNAEVGNGNGLCSAWANGSSGSIIDLSLDAGYAANSEPTSATQGSGYYDVASLTRLPINGEQNLGYAPAGQVDKNVSLSASVRKWLDAAYTGPPSTWRLHDNIHTISDNFPTTYGDAGITAYARVNSSHFVERAEMSALSDNRVRTTVVTRGLTRADNAGSNVLADALGRMGAASLQSIVFADRSHVVDEYDKSEKRVKFYDPSTFHGKTTSVAGSQPCYGEDEYNKIIARIDDSVFDLPAGVAYNSSSYQLAYWPQHQSDALVYSYKEGGTDAGAGWTLILRRQTDGHWIADCRQKKMAEADMQSNGSSQASHEKEIAPESFRFPSGDVALLYPTSNELYLWPTAQSEPLCNLKGVRQPEALQALARLGEKDVLLINSTGDLDIFECPSGRHIISGALLDDELLVYSDQGWFDGSAEATNFVQVRLPGVNGRYPLAQFEEALRRPGLLTEAMQGRTPPPVEIVDPPYLNLNATDGRVLAGDAKDLAAIRFYDDGVLVQETAVHGGQGVAHVPIEKLSDARQPVAVAVNAARIESAPLPLQASAAPSSRKGHLVGLTVGINAYRDQRFPALGLAEHDATALAGALDQGDRAHLDARVEPLTGADVTAAGVLQKIQAKVAAASPVDTLVFGFAGHAVAQGRELYLAVSETDVDHLDASALRWSDLEATLAHSPARVVIFLDACHSGSAALGAGDQHEAAIDRLKSWTGPPMLIFAASKGREVANESASAGGGLFTAALTETLTKSREPRDSLLTLNDIYSTVKRRVVSESKGTQTPWFGRRGLVGNFVLF